MVCVYSGRPLGVWLSGWKIHVLGIPMVAHKRHVDLEYPDSSEFRWVVSEPQTGFQVVGCRNRNDAIKNVDIALESRGIKTKEETRP